MSFRHTTLSFANITSTHDFNTVLRLSPGQYQLKFIVDDSWRCSKQISTATDDDGTLVNWIEVEAPKTEEDLKAEWAMNSSPAGKPEDSTSHHRASYRADISQPLLTTLNGPSSFQLL